MDKVDFLFTNAIVLTMDEQFNQYEPGALAVTGNTITAVGLEADLIKQYCPAQILDCQGKVIIPGLVNAHTHAPMTLLRGLVDDLRLDVWLMGYVMPVEREYVSPDFVQLGTKLACAEMIRSGVTTFADMYYFEEDIAKATVSSGMRALCAQTVLKYPTPDAQSYEESLAASRDFIQRWKGNDLIIPSVAPHAIYTCTDEILRACAQLAVEFDVPLHTHLAETIFEVDNIRKQSGMPVIPYVKKQNLFDAKVVAAHCVHVDEGEMRTMSHNQVGIAHNPSSNMKLASGMAPVTRMIELGLNVGIGTDGTASNNDLDMFEEMRLAAFLGKISTNNPTSLPARTILLMATRLGARALHMGHLIGSLEKDKRADLTIINLFSLHNSPRFKHDPNGTYAQIVYAAKSTDVTDVMVNGKFLMRNRELLTLNETELLKNSQEYAHKIDIFLLQREQSVLSKLIAIGGASQEESFEVQIKAALTNPEPVINALQKPEFEILRQRHYREYDVYFSFGESSQDYLRYREDHFINEKGEVTNVRSRLTLIGPEGEMRFPQQVILSRSRYLAPATQSFRFYREYFQPEHETEVEKDRVRYMVRYKEIEFFINIDRILNPNLGYFLEIKSRTWSKQDAERKSLIMADLVTILGASTEKLIPGDYIKLIEQKEI